jgi:hypothetical protein
MDSSAAGRQDLSQQSLFISGDDAELTWLPAARELNNRSGAICGRSACPLQSCGGAVRTRSTHEIARCIVGDLRFTDCWRQRKVTCLPSGRTRCGARLSGSPESSVTRQTP